MNQPLQATCTTKLVCMLKRRENLILLLESGVQFLKNQNQNQLLKNAEEELRLIKAELQTRKVYPIGHPAPLSFIVGAPKQANAQRG